VLRAGARVADQTSREHGFATVQLVMASALALVLLTVLANVLVNLYARAAIRGALDEGARAGALADAGAPECEARVGSAMRSLLGGPLGRDVHVTCEQSGDWMLATADVRLPSWTPWVHAGWSFRLRALAHEESRP
jgi:hypothetical protein